MKEKEEIEEWRPVKGYEGLYEISNLGNLYNLVKQIGRASCRERV